MADFNEIPTGDNQDFKLWTNEASDSQVNWWFLDHNLPFDEEGTNPVDTVLDIPTEESTFEKLTVSLGCHDNLKDVSARQDVYGDPVQHFKERIPREESCLNLTESLTPSLSTLLPFTESNNACSSTAVSTFDGNKLRSSATLNLLNVQDESSSLSCDTRLLHDLNLIKLTSKTKNCLSSSPSLICNADNALCTINELCDTATIANGIQQLTQHFQTNQIKKDKNSESNNLLQCALYLQEQLKRLRLHLEQQIYLNDMNICRLKLWKKTKLATRKSEEAIIGISALNSSMSMLIDDRGQAPPSTLEGIEKAAEKSQLPAHRKKYDWNLQIWGEYDKKRLWKLTASKAETDIVKLAVEAQLFDGLIKERDIIPKMFEKKKTVQLQSNSKEAMKQRLQMLNYELERKATRVMMQMTQNHSYKELLNIPIDSANVNTITDTDDHTSHTQQWHNLITKSYWNMFWDSIASIIGTRLEWSGRDCQIQWLHHHFPELNLSKFTPEEDIMLTQLAEQNKERCWDTIAEQLGTQRTAYQCFERYQRALSTTLIKGGWTPEEDKELLAAVKEIGYELTGPSRWARLAQRLPGRSNFQCRSRYLYSLKASYKRGSWSEREDYLLQFLVQAYGRCRWTKIARHIPWRTDMKCRERYENVLRPLLIARENSGWGTDEASSLLTAVTLYGTHKWDIVAKHVGSHRTPDECQNYWDSSDHFSKTLDILFRSKTLNILENLKKKEDNRFLKDPRLTPFVKLIEATVKAVLSDFSPLLSYTCETKINQILNEEPYIPYVSNELTPDSKIICQPSQENIWSETSCTTRRSKRICQDTTGTVHTLESSSKISDNCLSIPQLDHIEDSLIEDAGPEQDCRNVPLTKNKRKRGRENSAKTNGFITACKKIIILESFLKPITSQETELNPALDLIKSAVLRGKKKELGLPNNCDKYVTITEEERQSVLVQLKKKIYLILCETSTN